MVSGKKLEANHPHPQPFTTAAFALSPLHLPAAPVQIEPTATPEPPARTAVQDEPTAPAPQDSAPRENKATATAESQGATTRQDEPTAPPITVSSAPSPAEPAIQIEPTPPLTARDRRRLRIAARQAETLALRARYP